MEFDLKRRGISDARVLEVMGEMPREEFLAEKYRMGAYADSPLPIGCGQTISQPFIVALMTEALKVDSECEVLEVGTGSGYQTAILAKLARRVYTMERFGQLSEGAQAAVARCGIRNVEFFVGDGSAGWPGGKEFDRIIFTAAVPAMPEPMVEQLKTGGLIIGPVGYEGLQRIIVGEKKAVGIVESAICDVRFVRMIGRYAFGEESE